MSSWAAAALHGSSLRHSVRQTVVPNELLAYQPQSAIFFLHRRPADASQALVRRPECLSKAAFAGEDRDYREASAPQHSTELVGALDLPQGLSNLAVEFPFLDGLRPNFHWSLRRLPLSYWASMVPRNQFAGLCSLALPACAVERRRPKRGEAAPDDWRCKSRPTSDQISRTSVSLVFRRSQVISLLSRNS